MKVWLRSFQFAWVSDADLGGWLYLLHINLVSLEPASAFEFSTEVDSHIVQCTGAGILKLDDVITAMVKVAKEKQKEGTAALEVEARA